MKRLGTRTWTTLVAALCFQFAGLAPAQEPISLLNGAEQAAEDRLLKLLDTSVSANFSDLPLDEVMEYLSQATGAPIQLDTKALEDASTSTDMPVTERITTLPLRAALSQVLDPLDLTWTLRQQVVLVTTPERAGNYLLVKVYPVQDLVTVQRAAGRFENYEPLIETITTTLYPTTWDEVGEPGAIHEFRVSASLVISQTRPVHDEIQRLMIALRRARVLQGVTEESVSLPGASPVATTTVRMLVEPTRQVVVPAAGWLLPSVHD